MKSIIYCLTILTAISVNSFAEEGFFSIQKLRSTYGSVVNSFKGLETCGSVKIHKEKNIYLTALHCMAKHLKVEREVLLGSPLEYESLVYYANFSDKIIGNGKYRVLANGNCFSGFGLDVVQDEVFESQLKAISCISKDWIIFEELSGNRNSNCIKVEKNQVAEIIALGNPTAKISRNVGILNLKGKVYSRGSVYSFRRLFEGEYPFNNLSHFLEDEIIRDLIESNMILTNSDVIPGMSGGPVVTNEFKLLGISSLKLGPNSLWRYPQFKSYNDFMESSHGAIKIQSILTQLKQKGHKSQSFFDCK